MKRLLTVTILTALLSISIGNISHAQDTDKNLGVGIMIGEPTGITIKSWTGGNNAFDLGAAWSLGRYEAFYLHGNYLWHNYEIFNEVDSGSLPLYYGIGGRIVFDDNDARLGARVPVGVNYLFEDAPIGIYIEAAPILDIAPSTDFNVDGTLGVRFYL
jgi:hypothetical protein